MLSKPEQDYLYFVFFIHTSHGSSIFKLTINTYLSNVVNKNMLILGDLNFIIEIYVIKSYVILEGFNNILMHSAESFPLT